MKIKKVFSVECPDSIADPILDVTGSVIKDSLSLIEMVNINHWNHGLIMRGESINNPVLLHLHGGPGESENFCYLKYKLRRLEKLFTICYFEQRGSGKSYSSDIPAKTMNLDQMIEDAYKVTEYLRIKFNKAKIFVLGHSWGTMLGSFLINNYPENYYAYIGIGQIADQLRAKQLALEFIIKEAKERQDAKTLKEILNLKQPEPKDSAEIWNDYIELLGGFTSKYRGLLYADDIKEIDEKVKDAIEYTAEEKENYFKKLGARFSCIHLVKTTMTTNLIRDLKKQRIPVFILQGIHDYVTPYLLAKKYFEELKAPIKKFYTFENSAHFPHTEEYEKFENIIKEDVLKVM